MDNLIGKKVALNSGSPLMTIDRYAEIRNDDGHYVNDPDNVICTWFVDGYCQEHGFNVKSLRISNE